LLDKRMKNIIIIGNSAAGIAAVESIRNKDRDAGITMISEEDYTAYNRCVLSYYLAGEVKEDRLIYRSKEFYQSNKIDLILAKKVIKVDPKKSQIVLEDKQRLDFDILVIATGASAKFPEIKGVQKHGVFGLRTVKDAKEIIGLLPVTKTVCVLGGGLIGLKAGYALKKRGIDVKVIVKSKQVLSQILDKTCAEIIQKHLELNGLEILTGLDATELLGNGDLKAIKLDSGKVIGCEVVIIGKGVSPNINLVKDTTINVNEGIMVDKFLRTSAKNIFAAGDCAETYDFSWEKHQINALWPNAVEQGCLVGRNICGENSEYTGSIGMNSVEFFGLPVISMGIVREEPGMEILSCLDEKNKVYKKVVLRDNCIKGVILLNRIENSGIYLELIRHKTDILSVKNELLKDTFNYAKIMDLLGKDETIYLSSAGGKYV